MPAPRIITLRTIGQDLSQICRRFSRAPLIFTRSPYPRQPLEFFIYGAIFTVAAALPRILPYLSLDNFPEYAPLVLNSLVQGYVQLIIVYAVIFLYFDRVLKDKAPAAHWFSCFFRASLPLWVLSFFLSIFRLWDPFADLLYGKSFIALFFVFDLFRLACLHLVLSERFPHRRRKKKVWFVVFCILMVFAFYRSLPLADLF